MKLGLIIAITGLWLTAHTYEAQHIDASTASAIVFAWATYLALLAGMQFNWRPGIKAGIVATVFAVLIIFTLALHATAAGILPVVG